MQRNILTSEQFSNLLGTVYRKGNLVFTEDGNSLLSPVGNRVTVFNLVNNKSHTLPFAHRTNISRIALHPKGQLLLTIDEQGHAILSHYLRRVVLYHFSLRGAVSTLEFSPSGKHFAVGLGRKIEVWKTHPLYLRDTERQYTRHGSLPTKRPFTQSQRMALSSNGVTCHLRTPTPKTLLRMTRDGG
jgi:WD40 repeat protein